MTFYRVMSFLVVCRLLPFSIFGIFGGSSLLMFFILIFFGFWGSDLLMFVYRVSMMCVLVLAGSHAQVFVGPVEAAGLGRSSYAGLGRAHTSMWVLAGPLA